MPEPEVPSLEELVDLIRADGRLQRVPSGSWSGEEAVIIVRVKPSGDPAPYWQALVDNEPSGVEEDDLIRYVALKLLQVASEGFPPTGFTLMADGWWITSMSAHGQGLDYVPEDWPSH